MPGYTPRLRLPYPLPVDQVSQGAADIQALASAVEGAAAPLVVTAPALLPANPGVGQTARYQPIVGDPTLWSLVWTGAGWTFAGGGELEAVNPARIGLGAGWSPNLPSLVVPLQGVYDVYLFARFDGEDAAPQRGMMAPVAGAWPVDEANAIEVQLGHSFGGWTPFEGSASGWFRSPADTPLPRGITINSAYRRTGSGGGAVSYRRIRLRPVSIVGTGA